MTQTLDNGVVVPVNSDAYNLAADLATMGKKASVITNVTSLAQRNALNTTDVPNRTIRRLDVGGSLEYWDGTQWISSLISTIWTNAGTTITSAGGSVGPLTLDTVNSQNYSFITSPANGQLQVSLAGVYALTCHASGLGGATGYMAIKNQAANGTFALSNFPSAGENTVSIPNLYLAVNTVVTFVVGPSLTITPAFTIRASKIG